MSKARRGELITPLPVGLAYDAAGHVILDPDTAVQRRRAPPVRHLRRHRVGVRLREGVQHRRADLPLAAPRPAPQGRAGLEAAGSTTSCCACCTTPATPARSPSAGTATSKLPGGKTVTTLLPREEWIAFIPGAHPGYITLDQYEANLATLAANAAAHGTDRTAGPAPRRTRAAAGHHHLRPLRASG